MSLPSSDGFSDTYFTEFTEEDFDKVDAVVAEAWIRDKRPQADNEDIEESFPSVGGFDLKLLNEEEWAEIDKLVDIEEPVNKDSQESCVDTSFPEVDGLNLETLTEDDFARLDSEVLQRMTRVSPGPSLPIQLEVTPNSNHTAPSNPVEPERRMKQISPLRRFRPNGVISVSDLVAPTWCEVQYDYGLRGKRSRPIKDRPTSFKTDSGRVISVEQKVAEKNDLRTKQGLAIHKELQREIRAEELQVDITTKETQWALRITNMLACFKELLHGSRHMTREMPVFGILHDLVVVGIIDEIYSEVHTDSVQRQEKKGAMGSTGTRSKKRPFYYESQDSKLDSDVASIPSQSKSKEPYNNLTRYLHLLDAKTRRQNSLPRKEDALAGRLQLFIYRTLLRELIALDPPYDFDHLWKTLGVDSAASLPTRFLVQAQLIPNNDDFATISLNDLAASWHRLVEGEKLHISLVLELVYYRRSNNENGEGKERAVSRNFMSREDEDITEAIAASEASRAGSSHYGRDLPFQPVSLSEAVAFQLALERSLHSQSFSTKSSSPNSAMVLLSEGDDSGDIRKFPFIGKTTFFYDKYEMDLRVSRTLQWWRGEREPEGVPIELTYRCRTCEYANDCEWRVTKALELRKSNWVVAT